MLASMAEAWLSKESKWHRVRNADWEVDKHMLCSGMFYLSDLDKLHDHSDLYYSALTEDKALQNYC